MSDSNNALNTSISSNVINQPVSANPLDLNNSLPLSASSVPTATEAVPSILEKNKGWWTVPDFNGDKNRDIFWRNNQTGDNKAWLFSGVKISDVELEFTEISLPNRGKDWDFKIADFNGDGRSDFFWRNSTTTENQVWIAKATDNTFIETNLASTDASWYADIGDFNGDGKNDLVWRNFETGRNAIWLMNGSSVDGGFIKTVEDKNWSFKVGYANGDQRTDLYWYRQDNGENAIWLMNGNNFGDGFNDGDAQFLAKAEDNNWRFELGDTNGDGKNDLIWRNYTTGKNAVWLIDGTKVSAAGFITQVSDLNWDYDLADINGDGKTDLIWRSYESGRNAAWFVDGITFTKGEFFIKEFKETTWDFSITDINGDGKTDLIWRNYESGENKLWQMNGTEINEFSLPNLSKGWIFN